MITRRDWLRQLCALALASRISPAELLKPADVPNLAERAQRKNIMYGAAATMGSVRNDAAFANAVATQCKVLVPENELKWRRLRPAPDQYRFEPADWLQQWATSKGLQFRGHTLLWPDGEPDWVSGVVTKANADKLLREHVSRVAGHYKGKMHSWDVVNEVVFPKHGNPFGLRDSVWLRALGPEYITLAFRTASEADPKAMLFHNDAHLDYDDVRGNERRAAVLNLLRHWRETNVPIDGLGIQAHLTAAGPNFNPQKLREFLKSVAGLGLVIMISELDVNDKALPAQQRSEVSSSACYDYLSVVLDEPAVMGVVTWGLSSKYSWMNSGADRTAGLPLDAEFQPAPMLHALARAFDEAPARPQPRKK